MAGSILQYNNQALVTPSGAYGIDNLTPDNIKKNVNIGGIVGTYEAQPALGTKSITSNGTYNASSDGLQGYSQVSVNVDTDSAVAPYVDGTVTTFNNPAVTSIKEFAFFVNPDWSTTNLTSAYGENVTTIKEYAFCYCKNLTSINFPNCTTLRNNFTVTLLQGTRGIFSECYKLKTIILPKVTSIPPNCFRNSGGDVSTSVTIQLDNCTSIGTYAFWYFVPSYYISSLNLPECTSIGQYAFNYCGGFGSINLPKVETIGQYAFALDLGRKHPLTLDLPALRTLGSYGFRNWRYTTSMTFGNAQSIASNAISSCASLTSITLGGSSVCALSNTNGIPASSGQHITIYVPSELIEDYKIASNWATLYNNGYIDFQAISQ